MFAVPCEKEIAQPAQPVPGQPRVETGRAPVIVARIGGKGANLPACGRRAGQRRGAFTQDKKRDAAFFTKKRQPAARHQIEGAGHAAQLQHHHADMRAGQYVGGGREGVFRMRGAQLEQRPGIAPQFQDARGGQGAIFQRLVIRPDPEQGSILGGPDGEAGGKATRPPVARENLMQRPGPETPAQHGIRRRQP